MKIFLTGGTGFIGQSLTRALLARGWEVVALVRNPHSPQAQAIQAMGAACAAGDVTDRESMRAAMTAVDIVIHNAAWYEIGISARAKALMYAINVQGTENVLGLARELAIPRVVYVSSTTYFGETGETVRDESYQRQAPFSSYYEETKAEAHTVAQRFLQAGLPLILVCPAHVVGPNDHSGWGYFLRMYLNKLMSPFAWEADTIFSAAHVDDMAEGIALAAEKGRIGETYILAGDPMRLREILAIWMTTPGGMKVRFYIPRWLAELLFTPVGPLLRALGLPAFVSRETAAATVSLNFSSAKAQRELGWRYTPGREMWLRIIAEERALQNGRQRRNLVSRLKPVEG